MRNRKETADQELLVRILKKGTCPTLTGKSTLTYLIGCTESGEIMWQLAGNSSTGYFNRIWQKHADIQALLNTNRGEGITSDVLIPLYRGKSANSPSFLFAALKQEGLVKVSEVKRRCYDRCDDAAFLTSIRKLIEDKPGAVQASKTKAAKNNKAAAESEPVNTESATSDTAINRSSC